MPRILDTDLAERLEMPRARDIRPLVERHADALRKIAPLHCRETVSRQSTGNGGSREFKVNAYYLTDEQAAYVASKSEMPKAIALTIAMVKVFAAWGKGTLPGQIDQERLVAAAAQGPALLSWQRSSLETLRPAT